MAENFTVILTFIVSVEHFPNKTHSIVSSQNRREMKRFAVIVVINIIVWLIDSLQRSVASNYTCRAVDERPIVDEVRANSLISARTNTTCSGCVHHHHHKHF